MVKYPFVAIITFSILVYCCILIDYTNNVISEDVLNHPLVRLLVLGIMAVAFKYDHFLAILIGFSYLLTKHQLLMKNGSKKISFAEIPT